MPQEINKKKKLPNYAQLSAFVGRNRFGFVLISRVELNDSFVLLVKLYSFCRCPLR